MMEKRSLFLAILIGLMLAVLLLPVAYWLTIKNTESSPPIPAVIGRTPTIESPSSEQTVVPDLDSQKPVCSADQEGKHYCSERAFLETFDGAPDSPLPWVSTERWDVVIHSRDVDTWHELESVEAHHDEHCGSPDLTHTNTSYKGTVFQCRNHIMSAINAEAYGLVYFTPNQLVDFSTGEAVIRFDLSTFRNSSRDWVDLWITPYQDNLVYPLEKWLPDLTGEPRQSLHFRLDFSWNSFWYGEDIREFTANRLPSTADGWQGYEYFLTPDPARRDTYELRISNNHVRFGMPDYNFWWVDTDIEALNWSQGIVQFGHHSYNPSKACDWDGSCGPNTWHWDNVIIDPAVPFTMIPADRSYIDATSAEPIRFLRPAPENSHLRFAGIGNQLEVSFDSGVTWLSAEMQAQSVLADEKFKSYWMPIPAGTAEVMTRGVDWWGGAWHARDFSIWNDSP